MKKFVYKSGELEFNGETRVMGIVNITPDSFSDGGEFFSPQAAVAHARQLIADGAAIIDLGAMSTRPGSARITPNEEIERLGDVLLSLKDCGAAISVDTIYPETAHFALRSGADIINDVSGVFSDETARLVKAFGAGWIVTHTLGAPAGSKVNYESGVTASVESFFFDMLEKCAAAGIASEQICLDPGFGFAKTTRDNIRLLAELKKLARNDVALLAGVSRKRFIGELTREPEPKKRLEGTLAAECAAALSGADIIRTHSVAETASALSVINAIRGFENEKR